VSPEGARDGETPLRPGEVELRKLFPNMITAASLCAGLAAVHYATQSLFKEALVAVIISFILDGLDGRMARLLRATSRFGEVFDSMADFMAFGVAPAFIIYQWKFAGANSTGRDTELIGLLVVMLFALCAAIRLARFAASVSKKRPGAPTGRFFAGLPAPSAGGAVLIPPMLELSSLKLTISPWLTIAWTAMLAIFMVSKIPMWSVKGMRVSRRIVPALIAGVALLVFGIMIDGWLTASIVFGIYILSFPLGVLGYRRAAKKEASEVIFHDAGAAKL